TYGRSVWKYDFAAAGAGTTTTTPTPSPSPTTNPLPNTGRSMPPALLLLGILGALTAGTVLATRPRVRRGA
ncbi:MAG TPA: LPXTG cell wall anchor domain-containing protein, partial [Candidatus Dormibacteraeota bacterium]|nr:LPXTG cell wall anchor domain-containing protein [Candidatus Dormibacteraeota bacterium]